MGVNFSTAKWLNRPDNFEIDEESVRITTEPHTDFWQRSYYGFQHDNAPALLLENDLNFSFTLKASFVYQKRFDQCGPLIYLDRDNWFKASIEYEDEHFSRLGSVVTNGGYSDWATTDVPTTTALWYRLHRRGPDFLLESSTDGLAFQQMRIFHLHGLGQTSAAMGKLDPPAPAALPARLGLYACSPLDSSFEATFKNFQFGDCTWLAHSP